MDQESTTTVKSTTTKSKTTQTLVTNPITDQPSTKKMIKYDEFDGGELIKKSKNYDFAFVLRPASKLGNAIEALTDLSLNPNQEALLQVSEAGCEITVWNNVVDNKSDSGSVFATLRLEAACLQSYQCRTPTRKMVALTGLDRVFRAAAQHINQDYSVAIFVEKYTNRLSLQWGSSPLNFALGCPFNVDLRDAEDWYEKFPQIISYVFEINVPSKAMAEMIKDLSQKTEIRAHQNVKVSLKPATVEMKVDEISVNSTQEYTISTKWTYWKSVETASRFADNCSMYLVTLPCHCIMLKFSLQSLGDLVYLSGADFVSVPELPIIGHFKSLIEYETDDEDLYWA